MQIPIWYALDAATVCVVPATDMRHLTLASDKLGFRVTAVTPYSQYYGVVAANDVIVSFDGIRIPSNPPFSYMTNLEIQSMQVYHYGTDDVDVRKSDILLLDADQLEKNWSRNIVTNFTVNIRGAFISPAPLVLKIVVPANDKTDFTNAALAYLIRVHLKRETACLLVNNIELEKIGSPLSAGTLTITVK